MFQGNPTRAVKREQERKEKQDELGVCRIRRWEENQSSETLGSGFVVKDLQIVQAIDCQYCLISSNKVFPNDCNIKSYYLDFKKLNKQKLKTIELDDIAISTKINRNLYSGLVVIPISPSKRYNEKDSIFTYRPFKVGKEERKPNQVWRCHFVDDGQPIFSVKQSKLRQSETNPPQYQLVEAVDCYKTYDEVTRKGDRKPYGGAILKNDNNEYVVVGAMTFTDDDRRDISPVFFQHSSGHEHRNQEINVTTAKRMEAPNLNQESTVFAAAETDETNVESLTDTVDVATGNGTAQQPRPAANSYDHHHYEEQIVPDPANADEVVNPNPSNEAARYEDTVPGLEHHKQERNAAVAGQIKSPNLNQKAAVSAAAATQKESLQPEETNAESLTINPIQEGVENTVDAGATGNETAQQPTAAANSYVHHLDLTCGKQSPTKNSCRSLHFSSSNEAEAKQDLKGQEYVVNLPPENGRKEEPGHVEQLRVQNDDQGMQVNNTKGEPSVEVPAENVGDQLMQVDDQSVQRRNNNEAPAKAPGSETDRKRADKEENLPQDQSRDGSPQGRGIELRRASFPPNLPQKDRHPQTKHSISVFNQLQPAGRQRKFQLDDLLTKSLLDSLELLKELSRCLDQEYRYGHCKCWKHIAEFFDIPENDYQDFKCNKVHSPTEILFEFLKSDNPHITVGFLKHGLAQIERKDVIDILIKHEKCDESNRSLNDDTLVCSLFDSDPDIIGEMAFLLDKQKLGLKDWTDLAPKLGVTRTIFTSFVTCSTDKPTEQLFEILKARFPRLTVEKLIEHLNAMNRRDVILAIEKSTKVKEHSFIKELIADIDVMDEVCDLLNRKQRTTKVKGLKHLGHRLGIEQEILEDLLPTQEEPVSPTEALIRHLGGRKPYLTLKEFIWALHAIERNDALAALDFYMSDGCISNFLESCPCERCKQARLSGEDQW